MINAMSQLCSLSLFADDTCIICADKNYNDLNVKVNTAINIIYKWLCTNKLALNFEKTNYMIFNKKYKQVDFKVNIGNNIINEVKYTKYLGIYLQNNLKWNNHINKVINDLNKLLPIIYSLRNILTTNKKIIIYHALILSKINYAIQIYGKKDTTLIQNLQKVQNRLLKILFNKHRLYKTDKLYNEYRLLKINEQAKNRLNILVFDNINLLHNNKKIKLRNFLNINTNQSTYNYINKVTDEAILKWNNLSNNIKNVKNRNKFKDIIMDHYLLTYKS